uniref:ASD2 domain-containing protein n=1 Tax=Acrobeloides nanus TaxID=290746 RepID=A0A914E6J9_9BILA
RSILPDDCDDNDYLLPIQRVPNHSNSTNEYTGISLINTFEKPEPAERTLLPTDQRPQYSFSTVPTIQRPSHFEADQKPVNNHGNISTSGGSPTVANNITNTLNHHSNISSSFTSGKPTVEVHPMPAPRINSLPPSISPPDTLKKQPPPVPKKPAKLRRKFETVIGNDNSENENHGQHMTSSSSPPNGTLNSSFSSSSSSLAKPSIMSFNFASVSAAPSTESLHLLCASPSLVSLQNSLNHAYSNPQEHSREQLEELERRRLQSIESLSKKVANREQDRDMVDEEIQSNEQLRADIFAALSNHKSLLSRLEIHLVQSIRLVQLETRLQLQLEKLENANVNPEDADYIISRKRRTVEQLHDTKLLRTSHETRDAELDEELSHLLNDEQMKEWIFYKSTATKLHTERKQIEDRLSHVKAQLRSLLAMEPIVVTDQQHNSIEPFQSSNNNNVIQEPVSAN